LTAKVSSALAVGSTGVVAGKEMRIVYVNAALLYDTSHTV